MLIKKLNILFLFGLFGFQTIAECSSGIQPDQIISIYGKPDKIKSSEYDDPRPPLVTRMLEYKKEHVRFTFLSSEPIGKIPPHDDWLLIGTQDPSNNSVISIDVAKQRMEKRLKIKD